MQYLWKAAFHEGMNYWTNVILFFLSFWDLYEQHILEWIYLQEGLTNEISYDW